MATQSEEKKTREQLNKVSPCFCLAKWLQVTLHLHSGYNHSCHHPQTHRTPLPELHKNPSALHNTRFKKEQRQKMKQGERPPECQYCWNIEDLGEDYLSDRSLKSNEAWAKPYLKKVAELPVNADINPTYVEVSFSNVCNFKCSYCSANFSSRWAEELRRFGPYPMRSGHQVMDILPEEHNPYVQAFWDWWPTLAPDLKVFRVTGGEPLLSKNTFRLLENLQQEPRPDLDLGINSNLGVADAQIQKFVNIAKDLTENGKIKKMVLYTSVDAWGERAEYIRNGLQFERFKKNIEHFLLAVPKAKITIMVTFNALSLTSFKDLLVFIKETREKHPEKGFERLRLDLSYLRHPHYQSVQVLPESYMSFMDDIVNYLEENSSQRYPSVGFDSYEILKADRIRAWMKQRLPQPELEENRRHFYEFFAEHDRRRGTQFLAVFPEMKEFWESCKSLL